MVKQCNNCNHWRLGTASLDDNYCNLTGEWADYEGYCDNWGVMTGKRFRKGKSILTDFPTDAIIDEETGERYYDGIKSGYISSKELVQILNELHEENTQLKNKLKFLNELNKPYSTIIEENIRLKKENKKIKQLIHTMLVQIDAEKINTENARYSARIIFTSKEFKKIQQIWKGDLND